mmetsp:Transcript_6161/g.11783  ORF Transcript_6161/g.11783 Transcript_6161/m.11783 type:complete len:220 (+) Transcript_6161:315-974(+)
MNLFASFAFADSVSKKFVMKSMASSGRFLQARSKPSVMCGMSEFKRYLRTGSARMRISSWNRLFWLTVSKSRISLILASCLSRAASANFSSSLFLSCAAISSSVSCLTTSSPANPLKLWGRPKDWRIRSSRFSWLALVFCSKLTLITDPFSVQMGNSSNSDDTGLLGSSWDSVHLAIRLANSSLAQATSASRSASTSSSVGTAAGISSSATRPSASAAW